MSLAEAVAEVLDDLGFRHPAKPPHVQSSHAGVKAAAKKIVKAVAKAEFRIRSADEMQAEQDRKPAWSREQRDSLSVYTGGNFAYVNRWKRGGSLDNYSDADELKRDVPRWSAAIKSAMSPLEQDTKLYRGTGWEQFPEGFRSPDAVRQLVGKRIKDKAFVSTSISPDSAVENYVQLEIEAPAGTRGAYIADVSVAPTEQEYLLDDETQFEVLDVQDAGDGITKVRLRVVP